MRLGDFSVFGAAEFGRDNSSLSVSRRWGPAGVKMGRTPLAEEVSTALTSVPARSPVVPGLVCLLHVRLPEERFLFPEVPLTGRDMLLYGLRYGRRGLLG